MSLYGALIRFRGPEFVVRGIGGNNLASRLLTNGNPHTTNSGLLTRIKASVEGHTKSTLCMLKSHAYLV